MPGGARPAEDPADTAPTLIRHLWREWPEGWQTLTGREERREVPTRKKSVPREAWNLARAQAVGRREITGCGRRGSGSQTWGPKAGAGGRELGPAGSRCRVWTLSQNQGSNMVSS